MDVVPPPQIKWLVDAIGEEAALGFLDSNGGRRIWVPTKARGSKFARLYGEDIAAALSAHCGGNHYDVPLCREWRTMLFYCQGMSISDIAFRLGCSRSAVIRILGGRTRKIICRREQSMSDNRQMALFG